jgi:hypothetical protein
MTLERLAARATGGAPIAAHPGANRRPSSSSRYDQWAQVRYFKPSTR